MEIILVTLPHGSPMYGRSLDYYPFGMQMEERKLENKEYRFGYNTQERTDEIAGTGNHATAEYWEYSPRIARRWNVDPVDKSWEGNYTVLSNSPIWKIDVNGDADYFNQAGNFLGSDSKRGDGKVIIVTNKSVARSIEKGKSTIEIIKPEDQFLIPPYDHRQEIKTILNDKMKDSDYEVGGKGVLNSNRDGLIHIRAEDGTNDNSDGYHDIDLGKNHPDYLSRLIDMSGDADYLQYTWHDHP